MINLNDEDLLTEPEGRNATDGGTVLFVRLNGTKDTLKLRRGTEFQFRGESFMVKSREVQETGGGAMVSLVYFRIPPKR